MVSPSTKWLPISRIACRVAARTAGAPEPLRQPPDRALRGFARLNHARRHAERPRRRVDQERARLGLVMDEVALAELVLDELVGGAGVRHAQQRFRQHHQRQALLGGEREFAQHVLDAAEPVVAGANGIDQARRGAVDPRVLFRAQAGGFEQPGRHRAIVRRVGRRERRKGGGIGFHGMPRRKIRAQHTIKPNSKESAVWRRRRAALFNNLACDRTQSRRGQRAATGGR